MYMYIIMLLITRFMRFCVVPPLGNKKVTKENNYTTRHYTRKTCKVVIFREADAISWQDSEQVGMRGCAMLKQNNSCERRTIQRDAWGDHKTINRMRNISKLHIIYNKNQLKLKWQLTTVGNKGAQVATKNQTQQCRQGGLSIDRNFKCRKYVDGGCSGPFVMASSRFIPNTYH